MINIIITVDRIEENYAVCLDEDGHCFDIQVKYFPHGVCEGDIFDLGFTPMKDEKKAREEKINSLFEKLKNKNKD